MQVSVTHHISWTRTSLQGGNCDQTVISSNVLLGSNTDTLECEVGCVAASVGTMDYFCTDYSTEENWSIGQRTYSTSAFSGGNFEAV